VQTQLAEDLVAAVVRWRENARHQERWGATCSEQPLRDPVQGPAAVLLERLQA
jgi:hypothetical protein